MLTRKGTFLYVSNKTTKEIAVIPGFAEPVARSNARCLKTDQFDKENGHLSRPEWSGNIYIAEICKSIKTGSSNIQSEET